MHYVYLKQDECRPLNTKPQWLKKYVFAAIEVGWIGEDTKCLPKGNSKNMSLI